MEPGPAHNLDRRHHDGTDFTFFGNLPATQSPNLGSSLIKTGPGTFTLFGGNTFTGPTTVQEGTLDLRGGVAGDLTVAPKGTLRGGGMIGGNFSTSGTLSATLSGSQLKPLKISGAATLSGKLEINLAPGFSPAPGQKWTLLTAASITVQFTQLPAGLTASITPDGKSLEVERNAPSR